ncbi:RNA-dependent RNA polymerase [Picorna-like virus AWando15]|uniref:RNA-dependent RNA polymerase n=1 Tax=Picorna-like virus AWando15 TaxID=1983535 RepID=UPI000A276C57|nr:RNA-dependent RNA polymerase [Picorna-like virus AWando15]ARN61511.1 RNA-dependent RNA polymerase [Picorna-like virus AWando15]
MHRLVQLAISAVRINRDRDFGSSDTTKSEDLSDISGYDSSKQNDDTDSIFSGLGDLPQVDPPSEDRIYDGSFDTDTFGVIEAYLGGLEIKRIHYYNTFRYKFIGHLFFWFLNPLINYLLRIFSHILSKLRWHRRDILTVLFWFRRGMHNAIMSPVLGLFSLYNLYRFVYCATKISRIFLHRNKTWLALQHVTSFLTVNYPDEFVGSKLHSFLIVFENGLKLHDKKFSSESSFDHNNFFDYRSFFDDNRDLVLDTFVSCCDWIKSNITVYGAERLFSLAYTLSDTDVPVEDKAMLISEYIMYWFSMKPMSNACDIWYFLLLQNCVMLYFQSSLQWRRRNSVCNQFNKTRNVNMSAESFEDVDLDFIVSRLNNLGGSDFCSHVVQLSNFIFKFADEDSYLYKVFSAKGLGDVKQSTVSIFSLIKILKECIFSPDVSIADLFFGEGDIRKLLARADYFEDTPYFVGVPVDGAVNIRTLCSEMETFFRVIDTKLSVLKKNSASWSKLRKCSVRVRSKYDDYMMRLNSSRRAAPFTLLLHGLPGQGKSLIRNHIFSTWAACHGHKYNELMTYTSNYGDKYWEGVQPASQLFLYCPEVGDQAAHILKSQGDERMDDFLSMVDGNPKPLAMAFEQKGSVFALFRGILMDSNSSDLNIKLYKNMPAAFFRRIVRVELQLKKSRRMKDSLGIDKSKLPKDYLDLNIYDFKIRTFKLTKDSVSNYNELSHWDIVTPYTLGISKNNHYKSGFITNINLFTQCIAKMYSSHQNSENKVVSLIDDYYETFDDQFPFVSKEYHCESSLTDAVCGFSFAIFVSLGVYIYYHIDQIISRSITFLLDCFGINDALYEKVNRAQDFVRGYVPAVIEHKNNFVKIYKFLTNKHHWFELALVCVLMVLVRYSLSERENKYQSQGNVYSTIPEMEKEYDCWDSYVRCPIKNHDMWNVVENNFSPPCKNTPISLAKTISSNIRHLIIRKEGKKGETKCLGVKGNIVLLNKHTFRVPGPGSYKVSILHDTGVETNPIIIDNSDIHSIGDDLCIFAYSGMRFRNITSHFASSTYVPTQTLGCIGTCNTVIFPTDNLTYKVGAVDWHAFKAYSYVWDSHEVGKCGTPLVGKIGNGSAILGIHTMGSDYDKSAAALPVYREDLIRKINTLEDSFDISIPVYSSTSYSSEGKDLTPDLSKKSLFRYEFTPHVEIKGKTKGPVLIKNKSKMVRSLPTSFLNPFFIKHLNHIQRVKYSKPIMQPVVISGEYISPYNIAIRKINKPNYPLRKSILRKTLQSVYNRLSKLKDMVPVTLKPLTVHSAINGAKDDPFIKRMNRSKSAGFGYAGKKGDYLTLIDEINSIPVQRLSDDILNAIETLEEGNSLMPVCVGCLKDEPRTLEKCISGKTRLFYISDVLQIILMRMFLFPFYSLMVEFSELFCTAVGTNAFKDFDTIYNNLSSFAKNIMEGDYSGFDVNANYDLRMLVNKLIIMLLGDLGYTEKQLNIVKGLLSDNLHIGIEVLKEIFERPGLQPSGKLATAEDNSLLGLLMLVYFYFAKCDNGVDDFFDVVLPITYGDDLLAAVKDRISTRFNNRHYQEFCKEHYGIGYTSAAKSLDVTDFLSIDSCTFLKRSFNYNSILNRVVGCLDKSSLYKSLEWTIPSEYITPEEQLNGAINSFLMEAFLHSQSEEDFNALRANILEYISNDGYVYKLRTFEEIMESLRK